MKNLVRLQVIAGAALILTGCTGTSDQSTTAPAESKSAAPTVAPGSAVAPVLNDPKTGKAGADYIKNHLPAGSAAAPRQ